VEVLRAPDVREKLQAAGITPLGDGSEALSAVVARETEMWRDVVKKAGISVD
jgi:tripartite-type tricarboxylate transporter receptor subunit TctC